MNFKQLKYAKTLAEEGNFSKAAQTLNISQPSLSQYIKKIEQDVGMTLFERAGGDVCLTDAGRVYLEAGRKILDLEAQMRSHVLDLAENKRGTLVIGTSPFRSACMMPAIAAAFRSMYPGMHLVIEERETAALLDGLERGEFDFCLTLLPSDFSRFCYEKITEEELILAVPSDYAPFRTETITGRKYDALDAKELAGHRFVMITENQMMQRALEHLCRDYQIEVETAVVVKSLEAQIEMVKAGIGIAIVPSGIERFCLSGEATFYSFSQDLPRREVVVLWRADRYLSNVAKELIKTVKTIHW